MTEELVRAGDLSGDLPDIRGKLVLKRLPKTNERAPSSVPAKLDAAPKYKTTITKAPDGTTKVLTEAVADTPKPPRESISDALTRIKRRVVDAESRHRYERQKAKESGKDNPSLELKNKKTISGAHMLAAMGGMLEGVHEYGDKICVALLEHLAALENRIIELEKTKEPQLRFCGRWSEGVYAPGSIVELGGSAWVALRSARSKPSPSEVENGDWSLLCRRGRDGKDSK